MKVNINVKNPTVGFISVAVIIVAELIFFLASCAWIYPVIAGFGLPTIFVFLITVILGIIASYVFYWILGLLIALIIAIIGFFVGRKVTKGDKYEKTHEPEEI